MKIKQMKTMKVINRLFFSALVPECVVEDAFKIVREVVGLLLIFVVVEGLVCDTVLEVVVVMS